MSAALFDPTESTDDEGTVALFTLVTKLSDHLTEALAQRDQARAMACALEEELALVRGLQRSTRPALAAGAEI